MTDKKKVKKTGKNKQKTKQKTIQKQKQKQEVSQKVILNLGGVIKSKKTRAKKTQSKQQQQVTAPIPQSYGIPVQQSLQPSLNMITDLLRSREQPTRYLNQTSPLTGIARAEGIQETAPQTERQLIPPEPIQPTQPIRGRRPRPPALTIEPPSPSQSFYTPPASPRGSLPPSPGSSLPELVQDPQLRPMIEPIAQAEGEQQTITQTLNQSFNQTNTPQPVQQLQPRQQPITYPGFTPISGTYQVKPPEEERIIIRKKTKPKPAEGGGIPPEPSPESSPKPSPESSPKPSPEQAEEAPRLQREPSPGRGRTTGSLNRDTIDRLNYIERIIGQGPDRVQQVLGNSDMAFYKKYSRDAEGKWKKNLINPFRMK